MTNACFLLFLADVSQKVIDRNTIPLTLRLENFLAWESSKFLSCTTFFSHLTFTFSSHLSLLFAPASLPLAPLSNLCSHPFHLFLPSLFFCHSAHSLAPPISFCFKLMSCQRMQTCFHEWTFSSLLLCPLLPIDLSMSSWKHGHFSHSAPPSLLVA